MGRITRVVLILLSALALGGIAAVVSITLFLDGQGLRQRVEETLTRAVGRDVHIGRLEIALWSGRLVAQQMTIAEAPQFGTEPFVRAERADLGVEVWPLLIERQVRINSFVLHSPSIRLIRDAAGNWNYSLLAHRQSPAAPERTAPKQLPDLAISRIAIEDGSVLVSVPSGSIPERLYNHVHLSLRQFSLTRAFPLRLEADLPGAGHVAVNGSAGPWNSGSAADTPFAGHIEVNHLDLAQSGLAGATSRLSGELEHIALDLRWSGQTLEVRNLQVLSPQLTFARAEAPAAAQTTSQRASVWNDLLNHLSLHAAEVRIARLTVRSPDGRSATYRQIAVRVEAWSRTGDAPFAVTATLPGDGDLSAQGKLLPITPDSPEPTWQAHVSVRHLDLSSSGYLPTGSAIHGRASLQADVLRGPGGLRIAGTTRVDRLALTRNAQPATQPVDASFALVEPPTRPGEAVTGIVERATVSVGSATAHVAGTFQRGPETTVNLRVVAEALPIDQIEAFLPAAGVQLPEGSRLSGGTLTTSLLIAGTQPQRLVISGPVRLTETRLNGFNLGARLTSLARYTGGRIGSATGPGTTIRSLTMNLRAKQGTVQTSNIVMSIAGVGTAVGGGSVGPGGSLNYSVSLKLTELVPGPEGGSGLARQLAQQLPGAWASRALGAIDYLTNGPMKNGIPILIGGTTKHPTFTPNLGGLIPAERPRR